jgi:ParB family chromosome partitioning protein
MESGAAYSRREAERQIAEETGRPVETIRTAIKTEQRERVGLLNPHCETELQAGPTPPPICAIWTGDQEWYTPEKYIEAARLVMGSIDLDPASNEFAQLTVKANTFYTKADDGLNRPWEGNIFLNPPYSHPEVKHFVDKLLAELGPGQQAILLTNNNTDTNFFHDAVGRAAAVCFTKGRINFLKPDGSFSSPTNGQVFFYFGDHKDEFIKIFSAFGVLMVTI